MAEHELSAEIRVEVAYATPEKQELIGLNVKPGCTAAEAVEQSGIRELFPGQEMDLDAIGIFSRKVGPDQVLREGDRVEIYRPLLADPKEMRKQRAAKDKPRKKRR